MATINKTFSTHPTTTANTVDTVTLSKKLGGVEVVNRNQSTVELYVRVDGTAPTVGGDDCFVVPAASARNIALPDSNTPTVKVISSAACAYSVTAWDPSQP